MTKNDVALAIALICLTSLGLISVFAPLLHLATIGHHVYRGTSIVSFPIIGVVLLYIAGFVRHRRLLAVYLAAGLSIALSAYEYALLLTAPLAVVTISLTTLFLAACGIGGRQFTIGNSFEGIRQHLRPIIIIVIVGFVYGLAGFLLFGERLFHVSISPGHAAVLSLGSIIGLSGIIAQPTHGGQLFLDSLGGIGIVMFALLIEALFRPIRLKFFAPQQHNVTLARQVMQASSTSSEDFFKLWPRDKRYFFSVDLQTFITYKQTGRTVVVLGGPVGKKASWAALIKEFSRYCQSLGWLVAVVNADRQVKTLYQRYGFSSFYIGNAGVVAVADYIHRAMRGKHFRYVTNRAARDELLVEEWTELTAERIEQLRDISNSWLTHGGRREYTFFMGYFDANYLRQCRVFVVKQAGKAVAFVNLIPTFNKRSASIDMFRSQSTCSPVAMHFLLINILKSLHGEHVETLNMGLSPLSGIDDNQRATSRALLKSIRFLGSSYYAFQGLEQFKNKFKPEWQKRWLLVSGAPTNILRASRDIAAASRYEPRGGWQIYLSTTLGILVLTAALYVVLS